MIHVVNNSNNPAFNLATEEYFLKQKRFNEDVLILWQNSPTIVIGKNQNAYQELNLKYVKENGIKVVRRMSGGGAMYHDFGNLNFTVIKSEASLLKNDFAFFTAPVINCLNYMGVSAEFSGRNDILVGGKKVSGNAQYFYKNRLLHHGTLLFNSDLQALGKALNPSKIKIKSKGVKSTKSRVANIIEYLTYPIKYEDFKLQLIESFRQSEKITEYIITDKDKDNINKLIEQKYGSFSWNYGESPATDIICEKRFEAGTFSLWINVENGIISKLHICGDFFEILPIEELENKLIGVRYSPADLEEVILNIKCDDYIHSFSNENMMNLFEL